MYLVFDYDLSIWLDFEERRRASVKCCIKMQRTLVEAIKVDREKYLDMISESASSRRRETQNTLLLCWISRIIWFASLNHCFQVNIVLKLRTCRPVVRGNPNMQMQGSCQRSSRANLRRTVIIFEKSRPISVRNDDWKCRHGMAGMIGTLCFD